MDKRIRMQYPNIKGNLLCDGEIHDVIPLRVSKIENSGFFLLEYVDKSVGSSCITILRKMPNGEISKIPLLSYDSLQEAIKNGKLKLTEVDLNDFFVDYYSNPKIFINAKRPFENFEQCLNSTINLTQTRKAILLFIDKFGDIYCKYEVDGNLLLKFMERYDIEWRKLETNSLAFQTQIDYAIRKTLGHIIKTEPHSDGISYEEKYAYGNIHHYTVSYQYSDELGFKRGSSSI